ncbi:MAG: transglutaminase-like domain-containing protein, partial [Candidatus Hydrogenedentes bacterium]|nr:transglutaminase-like domain-containing protein [Candidatus Hydrogenedentota bacterium]
MTSPLSDRILKPILRTHIEDDTMPNHSCRVACTMLLLASLALTATGVWAESVTKTLTAQLPANKIYETGQAYDVMRTRDRLGVQLNDLVLIENDAPGAGKSEKGVHIESVHRGVRVKKTLHVEDPRAEQAHVVLYMDPQDPANPAPYYLLVNGHRVEGVLQSWHERVWWWIPVPVNYLVQGNNEIVLVCDAPEGEGYNLLFARADEYERGGGANTYQGHTGLLTSGFVEVPDNGVLDGLTPINVGETSARSTDGGQSWENMLLGPEADVQGEYVIRLNLKQHHATGALLTQPIDLWTNRDDLGSIVGASMAKKLRITGTGETPEGTGLSWAVRFADTPDPTSESWDAFELVAEGASLNAALPDTGKRFMQVRVTLSTVSPLHSPVFRGLQIEREVHSEAPPKNTIYVRTLVNPSIRYPSHEMYFESANAPQLAELKDTLPTNVLVRDTHGQFAEINHLRHYVSKLWYHGSPHPEYPEWNALDILQRKYRYGHGGMCIQFTIVFVQALQSLGYQARHVNVFNHEMPEVYIDELEKWVVVDAESVFDSYEFNTETGLPLSALEQHGYFLKRYGFTADNPIPW